MPLNSCQQLGRQRYDLHLTTAPHILFKLQFIRDFGAQEAPQHPAQPQPGNSLPHRLQYNLKLQASPKQSHDGKQTKNRHLTSASRMMPNSSSNQAPREAKLSKQRQPKVQRAKSKYKLMKLRHPGKDTKLSTSRAAQRPVPSQEKKDPQMELERWWEGPR